MGLPIADEPRFQLHEEVMCIRLPGLKPNDWTDGKKGKIIEGRRPNGYYMVLVPKATKAGNSIAPLMHEASLAKISAAPEFDLDFSEFNVNDFEIIL